MNPLGEPSTSGIQPRPEYEATRAQLVPVESPDERRADRWVGPGAAAVGPPLLRLVRGPQAGTSFALSPGTTVVGRGRDCDIVLDDSAVSRRHAELRRTGDTVVLSDCGSLNGTYLNKVPCSSSPLTDGDEIRIGRFRMLFVDR